MHKLCVVLIHGWKVGWLVGWIARGWTGFRPVLFPLVTVKAPFDVLSVCSETLFGVMNVIWFQHSCYGDAGAGID